MSDLYTKVQKLKKIYVQPIDQRELDTLEETIRKNLNKKSFAKNAQVRELVDDSIRRINELSTLLAFDEKATEDERNQYFAERRVHIFWLERIGGIAAKRMLKYIEHSVDYKLE